MPFCLCRLFVILLKEENNMASQRLPFEYSEETKDECVQLLSVLNIE